ncbi:MAG TPA: bL9 family ribosomal protein [Patescibacteria group bacterium]|nr:bL9 family ribosomal protein [Patescibacteria group bacterium]
MKEISVVLLKDVANLGKAGETVRVKPGFFRNFLGQKELAAPPGSPKAQELLRKISLQKAEKEQRQEVKKEKKIQQEEKRQAMKARKETLLRKKK